MTAALARWLDLIGEYDRLDGWWDSGCRSMSEWVAWQCGVGSRAAREYVRVAHAVGELPLIHAAFASGALTYSKVRALTRVATPESEADLLEFAHHATAAQLERTVRAAHRAVSADSVEAHEDSTVSWGWSDDNKHLEFSGRIPAEDGAIFLEALETAREALREQRRAEASEDGENGSAEPLDGEVAGGSAEPPPRPSSAECLTAVAEAALAHIPAIDGALSADRHQVMVHIDAETLATNSPGAQATGHGTCSVARGPGIAPEVVRRICCDSSLVPLIEFEGQPIAVGHQRRAIPSSIRRALISRDGCCQFPGCERYRYVDAHHIKHWAHGGATKLDNLVLLCRHHHRLVHEGGWTISKTRGSPPIFRAPDRKRMYPAPALPKATSELPPCDAKHVLTGTGEKARLVDCVEAVVTTLTGS